MTRAGKSELERPIAIRPTSETVMYPYYAQVGSPRLFCKQLVLPFPEKSPMARIGPLCKGACLKGGYASCTW